MPSCDKLFINPSMRELRVIVRSLITKNPAKFKALKYHMDWDRAALDGAP